MLRTNVWNKLLEEDLIILIKPNWKKKEKKKIIWLSGNVSYFQKKFSREQNIYSMILIISLKYLTLLLAVGHNKIANQALKTGFWATSELHKHSQSALIVTVSNWAENTYACASYVRTNPVGWSRQVYLNIACYWATGRRAVGGGGVSEWLNASQCSKCIWLWEVRVFKRIGSFEQFVSMGKFKGTDSPIHLNQH